MTDPKVAPSPDQRPVDTAKLYYKVSFPHVGAMILEPSEKDSVIAEADDPPISVEEVYMTDAEYEALPEFES